MSVLIHLSPAQQDRLVEIALAHGLVDATKLEGKKYPSLRGEQVRAAIAYLLDLAVGPNAKAHR